MLTLARVEARVRHNSQEPGATPGGAGGVGPSTPGVDNSADAPVMPDDIDSATPYDYVGPADTPVIQGHGDAVTPRAGAPKMCDGDPVTPGAHAPTIPDSDVSAIPDDTAPLSRWHIGGSLKT